MRKGYFKNGMTIEKMSRVTGINASAIRFWSYKGFITPYNTPQELVEYAKTRKSGWRKDNETPKEKETKGMMKLVIYIPAGTRIECTEA